MIFVILLAMPAILVFQWLGTLGTCTQGADGPFMSGVVLSGPLLFLVSVLLLIRWKRTQSTQSIDTEFYTFLINVPACLFAILLVILNYPIWSETLLFWGSPCGPDYSFYAQSAEARLRSIIIGFFYGPMPGIVIVISLFQIGVLIRRAPSIRNR